MSRVRRRAINSRQNGFTVKGKGNSTLPFSNRCFCSTAAASARRSSSAGGGACHHRVRPGLTTLEVTCAGALGAVDGLTIHILPIHPYADPSSAQLHMTTTMESSHPSQTSAAAVTSPKTHPCVLCQQRKVKCDRKVPCSNCQRAGVSCVAAVPIAARKRKKRFPEAELLARLRRYEGVLRSYGADLDEINASAGMSGSNAGKSTLASTTAVRSLDSSDEVGRQSAGTEFGDSPEGVTYTGMSEEFQDTEEILQGSSDDGFIEAPIMSTYDRSFSADASELLFGNRPQNTTLTSQHPSPVHIFRLWQAFLDNVNPLIKIFHAPTVQQQILQASANLENVSKSMEALMFSIYYFATTSLKEEECQNSFGMDRTSLLASYQYGAQHALFNAAFLKTSDIVVLQALTLYLTSALHVVHPRSLFCLTGIAVRIGQQIGLDRDGEGHGISPFDIEMRRRLWWQIVLLDYRVAELTGAKNSILIQPWNTKFPLNVNDSDLYPNMRDPPVESTGVTEMIFCLLKCEAVDFIRRSRSGTCLSKQNAIDELRKHMEIKYLTHCDPLIPLHLISILIGRSCIGKIRLMLNRPRIFPNRGVSLPQPEQDLAFCSALEMIECHNLMMSNKAAQRYLWYINKNFPFPAYVYLLCSLLNRPIDELADRAWQAITESIGRRVEHNFLRRWSPLHIATSNLTIKAWEARESALQPVQPLPPVPPVIFRLQQEFSSHKSRVGRTSSVDMSTNSDYVTGVEEQLVALHRRFGPDQLDMHNEPSLHLGIGVMGSADPSAMDFWNDFMQGFDMDGADFAGQQNTFFQM